MLNQTTRKMPTAALLMQLVLSLHQGECQLAPSHVKRELNTWADELTHPDLAGFDPSKRLRVSRPMMTYQLTQRVFQRLYFQPQPL